MLPLQLTLKNFMSYGDEDVTVDLRDMPILCLSGDNGNGKSALLDAMTWALWGETRLGKQNHDLLVRLGAAEMAVTLDFAVAGDTYRVRRQRSKRSGAQLWELQILDPAGNWRALTGTGSADTGRIITQLLRMSYETFLNSVYIRQGRADEFVRQTANKRKEILAEILDLSRFDDLEDRARQRMRSAHETLQDATRDINQIDAELIHDAANRETLAQILEESAELDRLRGDVLTSIESTSAIRAELAVRIGRLNDVRRQIADLDRQLEMQQAGCNADKIAIDRLAKLLADRRRIEHDFERLTVAQSQLPSLRQAADLFRKLDRSRIEFERDIRDAQKQLEHGLASLTKQRDEIKKSVIDLPKMEDRIRVLDQSTARYPSLMAKRQLLLENQARKIKQFAEIGAEKRACETELAAAKARLSNIENQNETCSVCGSPLPPEKLDDLRQEVTMLIEQLEIRRREYIAEGLQIKKDQQQLETEIADANKSIQLLDQERTELTVLLSRSEDLRVRADLIVGLDADIQAIEDDLKSREYAKEIIVSLESVQKELLGCCDAEKQLADTNREIDLLRGVEGKYAQLQSSHHELMSAQSRFDHAEQLIVILREQRGNLVELLKSSENIPKEIESVNLQIEKAQNELHSIDRERQRLEQQRGKLQFALDRAETLRKTRTQREQDLLAAKNDEDLFAMLAGSFSKRGVQALIIENALPELEADANDLLSKLTDGDMSVIIQTTKTGKGKSVADAPIETLEIQISDDLGIRPLEMYSGGEAFRVSFAIRIALSKLLARRAGANLQTLIIDEGFGTQDGKGREKLVESILTIQSEFAQIIVITHVDELKDAFPNRIEVVKTPTGSELTVVSGTALG